MSNEIKRRSAMIKEIKRRFENGERVELECIDESGFLSGLYGVTTRKNRRMLENGEFVVCDINRYGDVEVRQGGFVLLQELKFFRIKSESEETSND